MLSLMCSKPVHAQESSDVSDGQRAVVKRAADLCRSDPAAYVAVVRYADQLQEDGVEHYEALDAALQRWRRQPPGEA